MSTSPTLELILGLTRFSPARLISHLEHSWTGGRTPPVYSWPGGLKHRPEHKYRSSSHLSKFRSSSAKATREIQWEAAFLLCIIGLRRVQFWSNPTPFIEIFYFGRCNFDAQINISMYKFILFLECLMGREYYYCLSLSCLAQVQSSSIYDDLPIGYTLKGRTMSSLRNDSKQHRSITAPFWKNKNKTSKTTKLLPILYEKKTSVWKWFLRCNFGLPWWRHWNTQVYDFF